MKRKADCKRFFYVMLIFALVFVASLSLLQNSQAFAETSEARGKAEYAQGRILVKLASQRKNGSAKALSDSQRIAGMKIAKSWSFTSQQSEAGTGVRSLQSEQSQSITIALLTSNTMTTTEMLAVAAEDESIEYAEPDYKIYATSVPNDPGLSEQWAYNGDEKRPTGGTAHLDISDAWSASSSGKDVVVAVVDEGVDYGHPDLKSNMWNGTANGYRNHGWNSTETKGSNAYYDPMDKNGHGTHVAGIIAAVPDNDCGVAGAARNVKIIAAKVLGGGEGFSSFIIDTYSNLLELKKKGVNIVATNNSWKAPILSKSAWEVMEMLGASGVVNVIAAANDSVDNDVTPGAPYNLASDYSIVVAASTPWDELAEFSNYGKRSVHIAAPGACILSTYSRNSTLLPINGIQKDSFVKAIAEKQGKLFYYKDFTTSEGLTPGQFQRVSTEKGMLEWTITAERAGTYRLAINADIDLKSVNSESGSEFKDELYLSVTSMCNESFTLSLCARDENGKVNRDDRKKIDGNFNHNGNFWKGDVSEISDPYLYDPDFFIWPREEEAELVWDSRNAYIELAIEMEAGETRTVIVKDIAITKGAPYNSEEPYRYMDGTSMASPAAAGSLALIASLKPDISSDELRARIIGGAVKIDSLRDTVLSGGRLSVRKALENPSPVINSLLLNNGSLTVEGFFFGKSGTLTLNAGGTERRLSVKEWTHNKIIADLSDVPSGWCEVTVTRPDGDWGRRIAELAPVVSQWEKLAALPTSMHEAKFAADEKRGLIYIAACRPQEKITGLFACYNIAENKWHTLEELPLSIYTDTDETGTISASLGIGFTFFKDKPTVVRNYGGNSLLIASFDGESWQMTEIKEGFSWKFFDRVLSAIPAKDGKSLLILLETGTLWRVIPDEGSIEKLPDVNELASYETRLEDAMITMKNGVFALFGGSGNNALIPIFFDGENSWKGEPCPAPEVGNFLWTKAAFGWYGDSLIVLEGTYNTAQVIGNGAYYDVNEGKWVPVQTGRSTIRNSGASIVVGDYLYRGAITDYFSGVTDSFERLSLHHDEPVEPESKSNSGCSGGFVALSLLTAIPLVLLKKRK